MTEPIQKTKKISRRDAIKLLGAVTGATVLANLPSKWSTPEIAQGVLPAHAQTSSVLYSLACDSDMPFDPQSGALQDFGVTVSPTPAPSVTLQYLITPNNGEAVISPVTNPGTVIINGPSNSATLSVSFGSNASLGSFTVTWSFVNPAQGGSCSQTNAWQAI